MNEGKKVSVIVPIYNMEEYLERCIQSIIEQSYSNLEIILIDDGSTDSSKKIIEHYRRMDERIVAIFKENGGLSDARNCGIKVAKGEYLLFVDSDDYIHSECVRELICIALKEECDIVQCAMEKGMDEHFPDRKMIKRYRIYNHYTIFLQRNLAVAACGKLYKRSVLADLYFPVGKLNEDEFFTYKVAYQAEKIAILEDALYYYFQRNGSIMRNDNPQIKMFFVEACQERILYFSDKEENDLVKISHVDFALKAMVCYIKNRNLTLSTKRYLYAICKNNMKKGRNAKGYIKEQILINVFLLFPRISKGIYAKLMK